MEQEMTMDAYERYRASRLIEQFRQRDCTDCSDAQEEQRDDQDAVTAAAQGDILLHGLAAPYGHRTGDGREITEGALTWDLDTEGIPIIWDREDSDHTGMTLGRVDRLRGDADGLWVEEARLFATQDEEAAAAVARVVELIEENALGWSVRLDDESVEIVHREPDLVEGPDGDIVIRYRSDDSLTRVLSARVRHLALVDTPAFPGARPILGPAPVNAAMATVATYPRAHFERWESRDPVPLQVTPEGRVWGHAAGDGCFRGGQAGECLKYTPDPDRRMSNFHTGTVTLDSGEVIRVGALTAGNYHASPRGTLMDQRKHHEDSSTVWAKVQAWNDSRGRLCISGSVVPGLSQEFLSQVAGLPISVELWPVPGVSGRTLVGAHTVVTPAWPV